MELAIAASSADVYINPLLFAGERFPKPFVLAFDGKDGEDILPPCGNCRQMLSDYMPECEVILSIQEEMKKVKAKELLPFSYKVE